MRRSSSLGCAIACRAKLCLRRALCGYAMPQLGHTRPGPSMGSSAVAVYYGAELCRAFAPHCFASLRFAVAMLRDAMPSYAFPLPYWALRRTAQPLPRQAMLCTSSGATPRYCRSRAFPGVASALPIAAFQRRSSAPRGLAIASQSMASTGHAAALIFGTVQCCAAAPPCCAAECCGPHCPCGAEAGGINPPAAAHK